MLYNYLKEPTIFLGFGRCGSSVISEIIFQHYKLAWVSNYQQKFPSSRKINLLRNLFDNGFWRYSGQKDQLNEVPLFNKYIFKPGESYNFWNYITERRFDRSFLYHVEEGRLQIKTIRSFLADIVKYQNREHLSFKLTGPSRLKYLDSIFPDAKFIFIKRKPLPNIRSLLNVDFYQDRKNMLWWEGVYSKKERKMVEKWKNGFPSYIAALQYYMVHHIFKKEKNELKLDNRLMEVSYESFIQKPDDVVDEILSFVDLNQEYLGENKIYDRNKCEEYFIGPEIDRKVLEIANNGIG